MNKKNFVLGSLLIGFTLAAAQKKFVSVKAWERRSEGNTYLDLDSFIEHRRRQFNVPGISLAIVEGDRIVHTRGFGRARPGGEAPTPLTPFFIGSVTKSITALAIMQLVETDKIGLDEPVQRYLPWFRVADPIASHQITVRHLLNHTSGLSVSQGQEILSEMSDDPLATEHQLRALSTLQLAYAPGVKFAYNNTNYNILGQIIETISGKSYENYVQNHIFEPLEMHHSYFTKTAALQNGLAMGHRFWFGYPVPAHHLPIPHGSLPSGQIISCAEDISHFLIAQLNGGWYEGVQVLSAAGIAQMHHGTVPIIEMGISLGAYAMGWETRVKDGTTFVSHSGIVPDFGAIASLIPEQHTAMILLYNANHAMIKLTFDEFGNQASELLAGVRTSTTLFAGVPWLMRAMALIPVLQVAGVISTCRQVKLWEADPGNRPAQRTIWGRHILLPLIPNLLVSLTLIPMLTKMRGWIKLFMPDFSWIARISGTFTLIWVLVRTRIVLRALNKK